MHHTEHQTMPLLLHKRIVIHINIMKKGWDEKVQTLGSGDSWPFTCNKMVLWGEHDPPRPGFVLSKLT